MALGKSSNCSVPPLWQGHTCLLEASLTWIYLNIPAPLLQVGYLWSSLKDWAPGTHSGNFLECEMLLAVFSFFLCLTTSFLDQCCLPRKLLTTYYYCSLSLSPVSFICFLTLSILSNLKQESDVYLPFNHCDKILEMNDLKERAMLSEDFILGHLASSPWACDEIAHHSGGHM